RSRRRASRKRTASSRAKPRRTSLFPNGHKPILDRAIAQPDSPAIEKLYGEILLGCLREDFYKVPLLSRCVRGKGLSHSYRPGTPWGVFIGVPGAPTRADWLFEQAVTEYKAGATRQAFFALGRAVHLVSEMAAP